MMSSVNLFKSKPGPLIEIPSLYNQDLGECELNSEDENDDPSDDEMKHYPDELKTPEELLHISQKHCITLKNKNLVNECLKERIKCTVYCKILYGMNHWKTASSFADLAEDYFDLKCFALQTLAHCDAARSILVSSQHLSRSDREHVDILLVYIKVYISSGKACMHLKRFNEAEQALKKARKASSDMFILPTIGEKMRKTIEIKIALEFSKLYTLQKKYSSAQSHGESAAELTECLHGRESPHLIPVYQNLFHIELKKGRAAKKAHLLDLALQTHTIAASLYKEGSIDMVDTALNVAEAYMHLNQEDAYISAESYLNDCLAVCMTQAGPSDELTFRVQDALSRLYIATNKHKEAESILVNNLKYKRERYSDYSEPVASVYKLLGSLYLAQGHLAKSIKFYIKCYEIEKLIFGVNHNRTKDTQRTMDILKSNPSVAGKVPLKNQNLLETRPRFDSSCKVRP